MINSLIPALVGLTFFAGYLAEKDKLFKFIWLFVSLAFFTTSFFSTTNLCSTTTNSLNSTTTYNYCADNNLTALGKGFGFVAFAIFILVAVRLIVSEVHKHV